MKTVATLAVIAGAGAGLWLLSRAVAAGNPEFDELVDAAEKLDDQARQHHEAADSYDPSKHTEEESRARLPEEQRDFVGDALDRGGAWWREQDPSGLRGTGYETGAGATAEDRATIAVLECQRAAELGLIPAELIAECARELDAHPQGMWTYNPPGSRRTVRVYIGAFGHPSYQPRQ